jgi:hypothetical protein
MGETGMSDQGRSGVSPWLLGLGGYLLYRRARRARRRGEESAAAGGRVTLPDGREVLQVSASMFEPDPDSDEVWRRVRVEGTAAQQEALELTLHELAPGAQQIHDVPAVLVPLGTRRRVNAVDVYLTGGRAGHLPEHAVLAVGDSIRTTQLAHDQPCAVPSRIARETSGLLAVEVLLPETFEPGSG